MNVNGIEWSDRFNIGVKEVDKAHSRLFSIVSRILAMNEDSEKARFACKEGLKYFKSYAVKHFAEEEAYMERLHYAGYNVHKKVHDDLRDKTLPALEQEMEESGYSAESIQHFLGICMGWLTSHILIEDHAILGKASSKWIYQRKDDEEAAVEEAMIRILMDMFGLKARVVSTHYRGEDFGKAIYYCLTYATPEGKKVKVYLGYEGRMILHVLSEMVGRPITKIDRVVVDGLGQMSRQIMKQMGSVFQSVNPYQNPDSIAPMSNEHIQKAFGKSYPHYSLLFDTGKGYFAFCIKDQI